MLKRYWRLYAAFGLGALIFSIALGLAVLSKERQHTEDRDRASAYEHAQRDEGNADCTRVARTQRFLCRYQAAQPEDGDGYSKYDLEAQQEMARWAFALFWVSAAGLVLTALGIYFVARTLDAQLTANQAASDQFAAERRPWLSANCAITAHWDRRRTQTGIDGLYLGVLCKSKNLGQSPATHVTFHAEISLLGPQKLDMEAVMNEFCDGIRARPTRQGQAIFPGAKSQLSMMVFLPLADIERDLAPKDFKSIQPFVYGCINYQSAHTEGVRQTRFAYMIGAITEAGDAKVLMPDQAGAWLQDRVALFTPGNVIAAD